MNKTLITSENLSLFFALGGRRNLDNGEQLGLDNHICRHPNPIVLSWTKRIDLGSLNRSRHEWRLFSLSITIRRNSFVIFIVLR